MRLLVTNDDGIDSTGLHVLARSMKHHGEVVVVAPDQEYSGASAAFGAIHMMQPEIRRATIDGMDAVWTVNGPPALCVMFARLGAFGEPFDLVVSGINPGANVGRSVYHSGTVGAAITARNGGVSGIAVSQGVDAGAIEGQAWDEMLENQRWETAAEVASAAVGALDGAPPSEPVVLNLNVPNLDVDDLRGWKRTTIAAKPMRAMSGVELEPRLGHEGSYHVKLRWGDTVEMSEDTDVGAVEAGYVSATWLSRYLPIEPGAGAPVETGLDRFLGARIAP